MLRAARLALVASAAASLGVVAVILTRASAASPYLLLFGLAAADFVASARTLERDRRRGVLFAWGGALSLAGMGTLAGLGAGDVTFPAAALGIVAAVLASLVPPSRRVLVAVAVYVLVGIAVSAPRLPGLLAFPFLVPSLLLWPLMLALGPGALAIFAVIGLGIGLTVAALAPALPAPRPRRPLALVAGLVAAVAADAIEIALAVAQPHTSARAELGVLPLAVLFVAGALFGAGAVLAMSRAGGGLVATTLGGAVLIYALFSRPTVECFGNGVATSGGPWWLPALGALSSSGGGSGSSSGGPGGVAGTIHRGDGVTITYRCEGDRLVEFEIRR